MAMTRRLPSLKALQAAEAIHRLGGVAAAARALGVSQPAVSQQLKVLEADLGQPLFARGRGRLVATATGNLVLPRLMQAFTQLREAVDLADRETAKGLTVAVLPSFAMRWLIPRLGAFEALHPGIDLRLSTASSPVERLRDGSADLAIDLGRDESAWPGLEAEALLLEDLVPVASPPLAQGLRAPSDLRHHARLVVDVPERAGDWGLWLAAAGVADLPAVVIRRFESSAQALAAAVAGRGVALAARHFVLDDLAAGRLVQPFAQSVPAPDGHWLVQRPGRAKGAALRRFLTWVKAAAA